MEDHSFLDRPFLHRFFFRTLPQCNLSRANFKGTGPTHAHSFITGYLTAPLLVTGTIPFSVGSKRQNTWI